VAGRKSKSRRPVAAGLSTTLRDYRAGSRLSTQQLRNSQRNRASNRAPPDGATGACKAIPSVETEAGKTHDAMMTAIEHAFGSLTPLLQEYGVTAVMIIVMLKSIGLPLPGESVLILASVLAAQGDLSFPFLLVFAWAGAVTDHSERSRSVARVRQKFLRSLNGAPGKHWNFGQCGHLQPAARTFLGSPAGR
jgi:hypothetical protein